MSTLVVTICAAAYLYRHWSHKHDGEKRPADTPPPLARAFMLLTRDDPEAAIDVLDDIDTRNLDERALSGWLNLKANALALCHRSDEALELIDDLQSIADGNDVVMQLCIVGNRGLAHLTAGRLDLAAELLDDTAAAAEALAETHADFSRESLAETWFWRADLAQRRGDAVRRRECLTLAAAQGPSLYSGKATLALQKL